MAGHIFKSDNKESFVKCCANYADVNAIGCYIDVLYFNSFAVGGIAGLSSGNIYECSNHGNITATETKGEEDTYVSVFAGGISGCQTADLENCYNIGNVNSTGFRYVASGGISGDRLAHYEFSYAYNIGIISAKNISDSEFYKEYCGAIVGIEETLAYPAEPGSEDMLPVIYIKSCYYLDNTELPAAYFKTYTEENAKKLTAEEFKNAENFAGFDFDNIWVIDEELGRPVLQNKTKDVIPTSPSTETAVTTTKTDDNTSVTTTVPYVEPSTEEESTTQPVTEPTTEPSTEPSTEPDDDISVLAWLINVIKAIIDFIVKIFVMLGC